MGQYSIRDIETLSGIKAHTLRIWEQRYGFLTPHRTDTNIRFYSDEQLKMILNIALLNKNGYKISKIAEMGQDQVRETILRISEASGSCDSLVDSLIHAMVDFDEDRFEKTLNSAIIKMGFGHAFENMILPFLDRTGMLWATGVIRPVQEHFMSNLIRRKLNVAIDNIYIKRTEATRRFVLFLPEGEWHELMLLYTDYVLRSHNHEVIYLGASVPHDDLTSLGTEYKPDYLITFVTAPIQHTDIQSFLDHLSATYPDLDILIGGPQIDIELPVLPANVHFVKCTQTLLSAIK
jgi:DNA-binding transcriptional MerR regulator